jgi:hypothetical protein
MTLTAFALTLLFTLLLRWGLRLLGFLWDRSQPSAVYTDIPQDLPPFWQTPPPKPRIRLYPIVRVVR